jgi:hypothetical protein
MYEGLKYYHQQKGLWILNISGNSIFREIVFFEDGSTRCVSLSFCDSCADETQILGVRVSLGDYGTCAPYQVMLPDHWIFERFNFSNPSTLFGKASLNCDLPPEDEEYNPGHPGLCQGLKDEGASGWETDKLSPTAPQDMKLVAKGLNPRGGADMVVRDPAGTRGGMFSASSIVFGGCLLVDRVASMIVKNVISRALAGDTLGNSFEVNQT